MGVLFEAGKLTGFALLHRPGPRLLKIALAGVCGVLVVANVAGVSGFLSAAYEHRQIEAATAAKASVGSMQVQVDALERKLGAAEINLAAARAAVIRARDDRGRILAAQKIAMSATAERDALSGELTLAKMRVVDAEKSSQVATGEFAAVRFLARATGAEESNVARMAIATVSAVPDVLAVLLLLAAGCQMKVKRKNGHAGIEQKSRRKKRVKVGKKIRTLKRTAMVQDILPNLRLVTKGMPTTLSNPNENSEPNLRLVTKEMPPTLSNPNENSEPRPRNNSE